MEYARLALDAIYSLDVWYGLILLRMMQVENRQNGVANYNDVFDSTVVSALQAAREMLYDLENPLMPVSQRGENAAKYIEQEKQFYRTFIEKLEGLTGVIINDASTLLTTESTSCVYETPDPEDDDLRYITWYTEEGIFCRKAGQTKGYELSITFENREQYDKVMEFIGQFPSDWNMRFAAHENFWNDFLNDEIDMEISKIRS